jgi:tetratricopeptide (TPR) repeat protein/tRNA A-37 threonylcarbamoyl transferase component Bud32
MSSDHNLLFAVLALQADLLDQSRFVEACSLWASRKGTPLADLLVERGWLTEQDRADVQRLLERKLQKHQGDARASLAEVTTDGVRRSLAEVADPDVQHSLAGPPTPEVPSPGSTTAHVPEGRGRYTLKHLHAQGGIGQVWLAHDARLGRDVALKELRPERDGHPAVRARFLEEARVTGQLEHPGIVPVYELVRSGDGPPSYTMRMVRGRTLADAARDYHRRRQAGEAGPLELRSLLTAFTAVCQAVAYAHSRRVLHRDLKPANVVLGDYGEVVVLDWGLARLMGQEGEGADEAAGLLPVSLEPGSRDETAQGQVLGTPAYMAPEQAEGRVDLLGPATDTYGLGAVLYELLTGRAPFTGPTDEILRRVAREEPEPPRRLIPEVPKALEAVCLMALAKRPSDRYGTAGELAKDVERWLADEPVVAYREPVRARAGRWVRRHQALAGALAAGLLVATLLGGAVALWAERLRGEREAERARQEAALRQGVGAALEEVDSLLRRGRWPEAGAALVQVESRLGDAPPEDLRLRVAQARRALELVTALDGIRLQRATVAAGDFDNAQADRRYAEVFAAAGLAGPGADEQAAADLVTASPAADALVAALDDWAGVTADEPRRAWALGVARRADPNPSRDRLRDPLFWREEAALAARAARAPPEDLTTNLVAALGARLAGRAEGLALLRSAVRKKPDDFWLNYHMSRALMLAGRFKDAEGYYRAALALRPDNPLALTSLGLAMERQGNWREAAALYSRAMAGDGARESYRGLRSALLASSRLKMFGENSPSVEQRVSDMLKEPPRPQNSKERLALASHCLVRERYATAARLYSEAFAASPDLADDLDAGHRYNAATSAALAGCGKGKDAAGLPEVEKARLRGKALEWLRADLARWSKRAGGGRREEAVEAKSMLQPWQVEPAFAGVRDPAGLGRLLEAEQRAWERFWSDVEALLRKVKGKKPS